MRQPFPSLSFPENNYYKHVMTTVIIIIIMIIIMMMTMTRVIMINNSMKIIEATITKGVLKRKSLVAKYVIYAPKNV